MKRLFALLLALMLPVSAMAELSQLTLTIQTDSQMFPGLVQTLLKNSGQLDEATAVRYANALAAVLKDLRVRVANQDDAAKVELELAGSALLDATIYTAEDVMYVSSSLIPGYMIKLNQQHTVPALMADHDLEALGEEIVSVMNNWFEGITPVQSDGIFFGDAYDGGTHCTTWVVDDQAIAALASSILTDNLREALSAIILEDGMEAGEHLQAFASLNERVYKENAHCYIVRLVENDKGEFVGLSATITKNATQLATISLGATPDTLNMVVGLGLNSKNYWWEYSVLQKQKNHLTLLKGESREWTASKEAAFSYVKESVVPAASHVWNCNVTKSGVRTLWDGSVFNGTEATQDEKCFSFSGVTNPAASTFSTEWSLVTSGHTPIRIQLDVEPGKSITPLDETARVCSPTSEEDKDLITQLYAKLSIEVAARLMNLLPFDVIMTLGEMFGQ